MIRYALIAACLLHAAQSTALLPPLFSSADEVIAILQDKDFGAALPSGEPITAIRKNNRGYRIYTSKHQVQVNVASIRTGKPGPARFKIHFVPVED